MHAADATLLSSDWESFGLVVAESLAVGTPVLAAVGRRRRRGARGRAQRAARAAGDVDGLAAAIGRYFADGALRARLREAAAESVRRLAPSRDLPALRGDPRGGGAMKRRVVIVGPTRYSAASEREPRARSSRRSRSTSSCACSHAGRARTTAFACSPAATASTPSCPRGSPPSCAASSRTRCLPRIRTRRPGCWPRASSRGSKTPLILEVHGNWRTAARMYGSPARRLLGPASDVVAAQAVKRADGVRTISPYTTRLVRELGGRAGRRAPDLYRSRPVPRPAGAAARAAGRALRRRARALQGDRRARRRVARCRAPCPRCDAPRDRQGLAPARRRGHPRAGRLGRAGRRGRCRRGARSGVDAGAPVA